MTPDVVIAMLRRMTKQIAKDFVQDMKVDLYSREFVVKKMTKKQAAKEKAAKLAEARHVRRMQSAYRRARTITGQAQNEVEIAAEGKQTVELIYAAIYAAVPGKQNARNIAKHLNDGVGAVVKRIGELARHKAALKRAFK